MTTKDYESKINEITKTLNELVVFHEKAGETIDKLKEEVASLTSQKGKPRPTPIPKESGVTLEECRYLIGRRVRIVNPGKGEENFGTIVSTGRLYITVELSDGTKKLRIAKNLRLIDHEPNQQV